MNAFTLSRLLFWFVVFFLAAVALRPWIGDLLIAYQAEDLVRVNK